MIVTQSTGYLNFPLFLNLAEEDKVIFTMVHDPLLSCSLAALSVFLSLFIPTLSFSPSILMYLICIFCLYVCQI